MLVFEKPMLVLSVFANDLKWYQLQKDFLDVTTVNYVHAICLNNISVHPKDALVIDSRKTKAEPGVQHLTSLCLLVEYARKNKMSYRSILILDSDCFPIDKTWEEKLLKSIYKKHIACIIRPENFDLFPHPAAVFTTDSEKLVFGSRKTTNLLGQKVEDNTCLVDDFFPLMRTNTYNQHPVAGGIYYDTFYHHGAGSREFYMRGNHYYGRNNCHLEDFYKNPNDFIQKLRGR